LWGRVFAEEFPDGQSNKRSQSGNFAFVRVTQFNALRRQPRDYGESNSVKTGAEVKEYSGQEIGHKIPFERETADKTKSAT